MFRKYNKIHRLGKEEVDGILEGICDVQEKIDGANTSIWLEEGEIMIASRNKQLSEDQPFNGFREYVENHEGIQKALEEHPSARLYGEWLVKHTIDYKATAYKKFYLFDITTIDDLVEVIEDEEENKEDYWSMEEMYEFAEKFEIDTPEYLGEFDNPSIEQLMEMVGKSTIGDKGEGIVIKNLEHKDKWGNHHHAKIVTESFKEDNGVNFGGNNKHSDTYWEMYVVNKYITLARVQKAMNKIQPEIEKRLDMEHIPRMCNTVYHDMITEEAWEIAQKVQSLDYNALKRVSYKKTKQVYVDILNDTISIADKVDE